MNQAQPVPFWRQWQVGQRVVVRYRLVDEQYNYSDALGELVRVDDTGVSVRTRRGVVSVPAAAIVLGKKVPPPPPRRPRSQHDDGERP